MSEYVYFIKAAESGLIKIGRSVDVISRLNGLQTGAQETLEVLGIIEGDCIRERELHEEFKECRSHGEWFNPSPEFLARIDALIKESGKPITPRKICADEHTLRAGAWLRYLISREAKRTGKYDSRDFSPVGGIVNLSAGTVENIIRKRVWGISADTYDAIRAATATEYKIHIAELQEDLAKIEAEQKPSVEDLMQVMSHLARASALLNGGH